MWSAYPGRSRPINADEAGFVRIEGIVGSKGPIVDVEIGLLPSEVERRRLEGQIVLPPDRTRGIIDTGSVTTCIRPSVAERLLLVPVREALLQTASGERPSAVYPLTLTLGWRQDRPPDPIMVTAHTADIVGADVLIGLDVLRRGRLAIDGPNNRFELLLPRN
ncbi:MAG: hypothetical protein F4Y28_08365 [Acidimicrobiia bacterium]|nr:hypothetical protein [Acidimicrobiia bacterium]MYG58324.1 hypothetical protein [Acidimicrobiia bacterium]MYJ34208.1 hypothetical protein [Acidimicrobiia bacterium]